MNFELEDDVVKPPKTHRASGRTPVYPFGSMKVGQSFKVSFTSDDQKERDKVIRRVRTAILSFKANRKEEGFQFQTWTAEAAIEKDGKAGLRVKRVEFTPSVEESTETIISA